MGRLVRTAVCATIGVLVCLYWAAADRRSSLTSSIFAAEKPGLPPLKIDRGVPLLLEEPKRNESENPADRIVADNEACYVCHGNYRDEPMALWHARVNVGCVKCHGPSLAHRDDEDNTTPPDIMFPTDKVESACKACHDSHDVAPRKVLARWKERCPAKTNPDDVVCTDCHGQHHLENRTVRWDKATRQLLGDPKGKPAKK
jgi:hypothetical protein